jgi:hypothetical protein
MVYTGAGWTWFGEAFGSDADEKSPYTALIDRFPINLSLTQGSRSIDIASAEQGGQNFSLHTFTLPRFSEIPYQGSGVAFADGPKSFVTGWYDGGFLDIEGVLLKMNCDAFSLSEGETVLVEYRLDNDENNAYTTLGTFTRNQQTLYFTEERRGMVFKTVQFRITLDRGSDSTKSPELKALILVFDKRPNLRTSWQLRIDLSRGVERGFHDSVADGWDKLKAIWNTRSLLQLIIPTVEPTGINVRAAQMVAQFEEVRLEDTARSKQVDLTLLEPVEQE